MLSQSKDDANDTLVTGADGMCDQSSALPAAMPQPLSLQCDSYLFNGPSREAVVSDLNFEDDEKPKLLVPTSPALDIVNSLRGFPIVAPQLPHEMWVEIVKWFEVRTELQWLMRIRILCTGLAHATQDRVDAYILDTPRFFARLRLGDVYDTRRAPHGIAAYGRVTSMLYRRFEWVHHDDKRSSFLSEQDDLKDRIMRRVSRYNEYFDALFRFMETECQNRPEQFDGFIARLHARIWSGKPVIDDWTEQPPRPTLSQKTQIVDVFKKIRTRACNPA